MIFCLFLKLKYGHGPQQHTNAKKMAQPHRGLCGWSVMAFIFLSKSFLFAGCCEDVKPDQPSWRNGIHGRPETAANSKCRNGLEMKPVSPKISCNHLPTVSDTKVCGDLSPPDAVLRSNEFYPGDAIERIDHVVHQIGTDSCDSAAHLVGLGCRLRGGSKSHRTKCSHQGCKGLYMALAGDCPYCTNRFCMAHRLPEV